MCHCHSETTFSLTDVAVRPSPSSEAALRPGSTACVVPCGIISIHTVRGTVAAVEVGIALHSEAEADS